MTDRSVKIYIIFFVLSTKLEACLGLVRRKNGLTKNRKCKCPGTNFIIPAFSLSRPVDHEGAQKG